jgi:sugar phosphate isomerase/epimerase
MFPNLAPGTIGIRTDLAGAVDLAARHGWPGCDLPVAEAARLARERSADEVAAIFASAGVRPGGWGLPLNWREPYDQAALGELAAQAAIAARLGCTRAYTWLMPASNERPFRENFAYHVGQLRPVAEVLAAHGCRLGLEFVGPRTLRAGYRYGFIYSLEGMLGLAAVVGPNVGLLLDAYHWYTSAGAPADIRGLRAEDIVYVHVNDAPAGVAVEEQLDQVRRLPGATGVINIAGFLGALAEIGYDGPVTPEPFDKSLATLPAGQACALARDAMRTIWPGDANDPQA